MNTFHIKPRPIEMLVGEPIPTTGFSLRDMETVSDKVKRAVENLYYSRAEVKDPREKDIATRVSADGIVD